MYALFFNFAPKRIFLSLTTGIISGVTFSLLMPLLLVALDRDIHGLTYVEQEVTTFLSFEVRLPQLATAFALTLAISFSFRVFAQILLMRVSHDFASGIRREIYQKVMSAPVDKFENVGPSRVHAVIAEDVNFITNGSRLIPNLLTDFVTILGLFLFLLYLDVGIFTFVVSAIIFVVLTLQLPYYLTTQYQLRWRRHIDELLESMKGLFYGHKELKLDAAKRSNYFKQNLTKNEDDVVASEKNASTSRILAENYGSIMSMIVVGFTCFILVNYHRISDAELLGAIMVLMYISAPIANLVDGVPQLIFARVSYKHIQQLFTDLGVEQFSLKECEEINWSEISFQDVCYIYENDVNKFVLGPINLTVKKNQITFIVGGNGSGKSTLSKLITSHYLPTSGQVSIDNELASPEKINQYRKSVTAIFTDYYLFRTVLTDNQTSSEKVNEYLKRLDLLSKVEIKDGEFSTLRLSDGQRRRLALLVSYLDDKDLYLFDEWAADQDPEFKEFFYKTILPELKEKNKAIVVITHDDRYFNCADQIIKLERGQLLSINYSKNEI